MKIMDKDKIYLHIGYHKTGTTFLQQRVFPRLELDRIITPSCRYIAESICYDPDAFAGQLESACQGSGHRGVIISAEMLSGRGDGSAMWDEYEIAERLYQTFGERGRVIAVVREPLDYIMSLYVYRVVTRGLESRNLDVYLKQKFENSLRRKLEYFNLLSRYVELFGADHVLILAYEELKYDYHGFMDRLGDFLGVEIPEVETGTVNPGYRSKRLVECNRLLNTPIAFLSGELRQRKLMTQHKYGSIANSWFGFKRVCVQPVLLAFLRDQPEIVFPHDWSSYMNEVFRISNRKLQTLMDQDIEALGWRL